MNRLNTQGVLYVIACGSPISRDVDVLVDLAQRDGWDVCVVTTPDGRKFVDVGELARLTGHPVRSAYKDPGDADVLPAPMEAVIRSFAARRGRSSSPSSRPLASST